MKSTHMPKNIHRLGTACFLLIGALSLAVAGCGNLNDDPSSSGVSARVSFPAAESGTSSTSGLTGPTEGDPVLSMVVGALVITHTNQPYQDANEISDADRELLEEDALQSATYFEIVDLPSSDNTISFRIPPDGSGNWQLVGIGMRHDIDTLDDIANDSPIWYGFSTGFLNGLKGGEVVDIQMEAACSVDSPPDAVGDGTGACL